MIARVTIKHTLKIFDATSRYYISIPTKSRAKTNTHIKRVLNQCMHLQGRYPNILVADNAKEVVGKDITQECKSLGVKLQPIVPHYPQENYINERIHRKIYEAARSALSHAQLDNSHWDSAVLDGTYKYNNLLHSVTGQILHHKWFHSKHTFKNFLPFDQYGTTVIGNVTNK